MGVADVPRQISSRLEGLFLSLVVIVIVCAKVLGKEGPCTSCEVPVRYQLGRERVEDVQLVVSTRLPPQGQLQVWFRSGNQEASGFTLCAWPKPLRTLSAGYIECGCILVLLPGQPSLMS